MSYFMAVVVGYVLMLAVCTIIFGVANRVAFDPSFVLRKAYANNVCGKAVLKDSELSEDGLYTATYTYQYKGAIYQYTKYWYNETPHEQIEIIWRAHAPTQVSETSELRFDRKKFISRTVIEALIAAVAGLIVPQLAVIGAAITYAVWRLVPITWARIVATAVVGFFAFTLCIGALPDFYPAHKEYERAAELIPQIEQLEPVALADLYEDYSYSMYEWQDWQDVRSVPLFCQYGDSYWEGKPRLVWPVAYQNYEDWDYRDKVREEAGK